MRQILFRGKYPKQDEWKYSSFWYKDFDTMACGKIQGKPLVDAPDATEHNGVAEKIMLIW